jgi:hypothetical protein
MAQAYVPIRGWSLGGRETLRRLKVGPRSTDDGNVGPHQPADPLRGNALPIIAVDGSENEAACRLKWEGLIRCIHPGQGRFPGERQRMSVKKNLIVDDDPHLLLSRLIA